MPVWLVHSWFWTQCVQGLGSNLLASLVCFLAAAGWARKELLKLHRRHDAAEQAAQRRHHELMHHLKHPDYPTPMPSED